MTNASAQPAQDSGEEMKNLLKNPYVMNALREKLEGISGQKSEYIESLSTAVKKRINALKHYHEKRLELDAKLEAEVLELEKKYLKLAEPIYAARAKIVSGDHEPSKEECENRSPIEIESKITEVDEEGQETAAQEKGIPSFWLTCLTAHPAIEEIITEEDDKVLSSLMDIKVSYLENNPGFKLDFFFAENEFFENKVLSKAYYLKECEEEHHGCNEIEFDRAEGSEIRWKSGKNLCEKVVVKTQRNKKTNVTRTIKRTVRCDSFFNFFSPPSSSANCEEDDDNDGTEDNDREDDIETRIQSDYELGELLKNRIVPYAIDWFTGDAANFSQEEDEDDDYYDDDDDEYGTDEDSENEEDYEDGRRPQLKSQTTNPGEAPQCKQQ